jgi:hypothetical protein
VVGVLERLSSPRFWSPRCGVLRGVTVERDSRPRVVKPRVSGCERGVNTGFGRGVRGV